MQNMDGTANERQLFCTFKIAQRLFGVKVIDIKEIHPVVNVTPVSHATEDVKGFVNIRGQVHLVIDLRVLLGFKHKTIDDSNQILLFKPHVGEAFGILVDFIGDVVETSWERIETLGKTDHNIHDKNLHHFSDFAEGICKLENELMVILNSMALLKKIEEKHKK